MEHDQTSCAADACRCGGTTRRGFLQITTGVVLSASLGVGTAACGDDDGDPGMDVRAADAAPPDAASSDGSSPDASPGDASGVDSTADASGPAGVFAAALASVGEGDVIFVDAAGAYLLRDAGGLYAVSSTCTHLGCTIGDQGTRFDCPCHGSRFGYDGDVIQGPAVAPLTHFAVAVSGGDVYIDPDTTVPAQTRLAV